MRVITDKSFKGEEGMVRIWNQTPGFVQVTDEGHLLASLTSAWVDDSATVRALIESNEVVVLDGSVQKTPKKSTKTRAKAIDQSPQGISEDLPVAPTPDPEQPHTEIQEQPQTSTENIATLDSLILDSSTLPENTDSVSVENI